MYSINRSAAIIRLKQPFIKWASSHSGDGREFSSEYFKKDCTVILIPEYDTEREARAHINKIWDEIFEEELESWDTDERWWPKHRTQKMFWQWFGAEFHSVVDDPDGEPIKKGLV